MVTRFKKNVFDIEQQRIITKSSSSPLEFVPFINCQKHKEVEEHTGGISMCHLKTSCKKVH